MRAKAPAFRDALAALVALPSVSSARDELDQPNRPVVDLLAGWLEDLGFSVQIQPLDPALAGGHTGKANLVATLGAGQGSGNTGLVLAGHTDTVPYDAGRWTHDPFKLTEADGRLYGLGTADMKGFLALALEAAREVDAGALRHPLTILATADEESSMAGAKALAQGGVAPGRYCVIGEPTSLVPVHAHKGIMMEHVHLTGQAGHSSDPSLGVSALDGMYRVMGALMAWREELAETHRDPRFKVPFPTLNLGHIRGGDNPNRICAECELSIDVRLMPGMGVRETRAELERRVRGALEGSRLKVRLAPLFEGIPAMETPKDAELVKVLEALTGHPAGSVTFGTEGPYLSGLGCETVVMGPGDLGAAHQPDESLRLDRLRPTLDVLAGLIGRFCLTDERGGTP
jgi:acetylornithine deacetylase